MHLSERNLIPEIYKLANLAYELLLCYLGNCERCFLQLGSTVILIKQLIFPKYPNISTVAKQ